MRTLLSSHHLAVEDSRCRPSSKATGMVAFNRSSHPTLSLRVELELNSCRRLLPSRSSPSQSKCNNRSCSQPVPTLCPLRCNSPSRVAIQQPQRQQRWQRRQTEATLQVQVRLSKSSLCSRRQCQLQPSRPRPQPSTRRISPRQ